MPSSRVDSASQEAFESMAREVSSRTSAGDLPAAIRLLIRGLEQFPRHAGLLNNLGASQLECGLVSDARENLQRSLCVTASPQVFSNLLLALQCDIRSSNPESLQFASAYGSLVTKPESLTSSPGITHRTRIRIGYISDGFRRHPCHRVLSTLLRYHSDRFDVYCYPTSSESDKVTRRLRRLGGKWRNVSKLSDQQAAQRIRGDGIDILIETSGHHGPNRLPILALRSAPLQVSLNAFPATLGIPTVDCRITDAIVEPPGIEQFYVEKRLVRLDRPVDCYFPLAKQPVVNTLPACDSGKITFAAFHRLSKISTLSVKCWAEILKRLPGSKIMFHHVFGGADRPSAAFRAPLERQFHENGIAPRRLQWIGRRSVEDTMNLYNQCDISLDPFPFSGSATTLESMWMGVPVVTFAGERPVSRFSASFLTTAGLSDWVTYSPEDYVERVVGAARDLDRLGRIRQSLRKMMSASPLMDGADLVGKIEKVYFELLRSRPER